MNIVDPKSKTPNSGKKDFWITNDLGTSNILYVGVYLYYAQGGYLAKKLADAGATGVVIKWETGATRCNLMTYEVKNLPAYYF